MVYMHAPTVGYRPVANIRLIQYAHIDTGLSHMHLPAALSTGVRYVYFVWLHPAGAGVGHHPGFAAGAYATGISVAKQYGVSALPPLRGLQQFQIGQLPAMLYCHLLVCRIAFYHRANLFPTCERLVRIFLGYGSYRPSTPSSIAHH